MLRSEKERVVAELAERLRDAQTLMVADYRGLTMTEIDELRTRLLEAGARFTVVKNTLTRLAAEEAGTKDVLDLIEGPTAIAFLEADSDPAAVAKVLHETARARDVLVIRGGVLDGELVGDADIKRLATLPPLEVLHAQFAGAVAGPLAMVVGLFAAPLRELVGVIDARIRQLEEGGEGVPEPADSVDVESASSEESADEAPASNAAEAVAEPAQTPDDPAEASEEETTTSTEAEPPDEPEEETSGED
jgi:large subunit ribosomal protein L10